MKNKGEIMKKILVALCSIIMLCAAQKQDVQLLSAFDETIFNWSRTFAQVIDITNKKHYQIKDPQDGMIKAIDAFVNHLDPHSSFLDPQTYKNMLESTIGEFFGVGIIIDNTRKPKDKYLTVVDTILDGPADKVGIQPLDKIIEIDGEPLEGITTEQATTKLKGERHTKVHIKVLREKHYDLISFDITRDVVKEQYSLSFHIKNQDIYYISLSMFTENAVKQIEKLIKKSNEQHYKGLIFDLRNNSGGLLNAVIDIAGLFLDKQSLVVLTKDKNNQELERYATTRKPIVNTRLPIFILINNYTASAAEILAGCLKIHSEKQTGEKNNFMVFLIGTKTFGKGSVQEVIPVSNNCALKITTSLYFFSDNTTIQGTGIEPDFVIERTLPLTEQMQWFTKHYGREQTLDNYIKISKSTENEKTKQEKKEEVENKSNRWQERAKEMLRSDNQLRETITLINMLYNAQIYTPDLVKNRKQAVTFLKQSHISNDILEIEEIKL